MSPVIGSQSTRRGFVAGAAGAAGALALPRRTATARAAGLSLDARPDVVHRGRAIAVTANGRLLVIAQAQRRALTVIDRHAHTKRSVDLPGHPLELAVAGNSLVAVTTAPWDKPGVTLIRLSGSAKPTTIEAGASPFAPAFTHDRRHLLIAGGEQSGALRIHSGPGYGQSRTVALGRVPRGLVITPDDRGAWVALQGEDAVVRVDLRSGKVTRRVATAGLPDRLALSADGRHLLVSHGGHGEHRLTEIETRTGRAHRLGAGGRVAAVAYGRSGRRLAVLRDENAIVAIAAGGKRRRTATVTSPRGLAVAGSHAFTVSAITGDAGRVRA